MDDPASTKAYEPANEATQLTQVAFKGVSDGASSQRSATPFCRQQQMSARTDYKPFRDTACDTTRREFKQRSLIDKNVFTLVRSEHLTQEEQEQSLRVVNLIS